MRTILLLALVLASTAASAAPLEGDVEIDPTAYILSGNSIHAGLASGHWRVDLGNFGIAIPRAIHGNDDFDVSATGYGVKLEYFARARRTGWFAGIDAGYIRTHARLRGTDLAGDDASLSTGIHAGYRISLPANLYVTPWIGVGYSFGSDDIAVGNARFAAIPVTIFPAVHLGYRFR
ncbi:MAG: hypothetical protein KF773_17880 [Deltaproteobacteria bacterium]|nr:hypothetical protein [Deltaproteobacteria bacterium]MCW5807930.1 hypothetical protein [Deltaproteobacteria bacterium]